jgi:phosphotransferase family enzyme
MGVENSGRESGCGRTRDDPCSAVRYVGSDILAWVDVVNESVSRALRETFGTSEVDEIQPVTGGFRIVVRTSAYLVRVMPHVDERNDPARIFACMSVAAEAGIAPRVRYSNVEAGIAICDWVAGVPFPAAQALIELPGVLRKLHAMARFPKAFNWVTPHKFFIWKLRDAGLLPQEEVEEVFARYEEVCAAYPRVEADMVSCHMDLKPPNIVFDGERVWLIGWQAAMVNDRYFDLAVAADFLVGDDADESTLLERYFGERADEVQRARFFLMRQVVQMLSAAVYLMLGSGERARGMVHWERLARDVRSARLAEAIRIVRGTGEDRLLPKRIQS